MKKINPSTGSGCKIIFLTILFSFFIYANEVMARAGGGGSSSGGGGGGGGSSSHYSSGSSSGEGNLGVFVVLSTILAFIFVAMYRDIKKTPKDQQKKHAEIIKKENLDWESFRKRVEDVFYKFEEAWGKFDLATMKTLLSLNYYKRMVLELNVLQNEKRASIMEDVNLKEFFIISSGLGEGGEKKFTVQITAKARDILLDQETNKNLFVDTRQFTEYWHFINQNGEWTLELITQSTEDKRLVEGAIADFARKNGFYFDPDFGWIMMPNRGVLFSFTNFGSSDINNHVIGYYREKIVEFYTYRPDPGFGGNYLVAQAILPKGYNNILVKKKKWNDLAPRGLRKIELESIDFNNKFNLWASPQDQISSLELLTPNFMEKIYNLSFELNIEIVGNFLYFYTKDRGAANYDKMLEIISWAFDEMKM